MQDIAKARQISELRTEKFRLSVLQDGQTHAVRRLGGAHKIFNSLAGCDNRTVPFARGPKRIENLRPQNRIGQHGPDLVKNGNGWTEIPVRVLAADLLIYRSGNRESDCRL